MKFMNMVEKITTEAIIVFSRLSKKPKKKKKNSVV